LTGCQSHRTGFATTYRFNTWGEPQPQNDNNDKEARGNKERQRTPRHRPRYSFKERKRKIVHDPPPRAKQFLWKPHKERSEASTSTIASKDSKSKDGKAPSVKRTKPLAEMDKMSLTYSLSWYHPTSTLEVGTLHANVKRVLQDKTNATNAAQLTNLNGLQQEVVDCVREASHLAAGMKREGQRLIGQFVEKLRERIAAAEEQRRIELAKATTPRIMTEQERLQARREAITEPERTILIHLCNTVNPKDMDNDQARVDGNRNDDSTDLDGSGIVKCNSFGASSHTSIRGIIQ
ncbi:hypothetical protein BGZ58_003973, partial [Dissophora ornata]